MQGTTTTDSNLLAKNLKVNKEKIEFWKFLMYSTKAEVHIHEFQSLVYWVSIMECFLFVVALALFISHPIMFAILWCFITHLVRAVLGFLLLSLMPTTHDVIENIKEFGDSSIGDIENQILLEYKKLLNSNEGKMKPVLIAYFIFTIIDIIIDNVIFFFLLQKWTNIEYNFQNIIVLVMIVCFFCMNSLYNFSVQWCLLYLAFFSQHAFPC